MKGSNEKSSGNCYLTSACMCYFQEQFDNQCYELQVLRWFRDTFVSKDEIEHYYNVAPIIVQNINKDSNSDNYYNYIYDNVIDYCVREIENGNYSKAYDRYKDTILILEQHARLDLPQKEDVKVLRLI